MRVGVVFLRARLVGMRVGMFGPVVVGVRMLVLDVVVLVRLRRVLGVVPVF